MREFAKKVQFLVRALAAGIIFCSGACYSVEFFPSPDYPNLRRSDVGEVEIRRSRPERSFQSLGRLVVRDASADLQDPSFVAFLQSEARSRGAAGIWVQSTALDRSQSMRTGTRQRDGHLEETGQLELARNQLNILLYNYAGEVEVGNSR
ncbi:MAG: hypothetical protein K1X75_04570 [Leptospirales bacterium]|nr:hypothetical protein [Leptospirales bacterium]